MYGLIIVDLTQFTAHWNKSERPLSKKNRSLGHSAPAARLKCSVQPASNVLVLSPMLANNGYLQSEQM
jgi:hypothetical protein